MHVCDHCWYQAMISGGEDCGFFVFTKTFECKTCKSIDDYEIALTPGGKSMNFPPVGDPVCEECNNKDLIPWDLALQGHCPQCGHQMRLDESGGSINWD